MFNVYLYQHDATLSAIVATDQPIIGGAENDRALSGRVVTLASQHADLETAIEAADNLVDANNPSEYPMVSELRGAQAARSGRTYDGSPILYRQTVEADMGEGFPDA